MKTIDRWKIALSLLALSVMLPLLVSCDASNPANVVTSNSSPIVGAMQLIDENGDAYGVKHVDNKPRVSATPYAYDIVEGNVPNHAFINKFGHNSDVGAAVETVWSGSTLYAYLAAADQMVATSSNDEDGGAGGDTGALIMNLQGVDTNYDYLSENITLNGTTNATTVGSFLRVYRAIVLSAGSTGWNIGTITVRDQGTATARLLVPPFKNQTLMAMWTVPAGYTAYLTSWYASSAISTKSAEIELYVHPFGQVFQVKRSEELIGSTFERTFVLPQQITEKSDIEMRASTSGAGGSITGGFSLWYEAN